MFGHTCDKHRVVIYIYILEYIIVEYCSIIYIYSYFSQNSLNTPFKLTMKKKIFRSIFFDSVAQSLHVHTNYD